VLDDKPVSPHEKLQARNAGSPVHKEALIFEEIPDEGTMAKAMPTSTTLKNSKKNEQGAAFLSSFISPQRLHGRLFSPKNTVSQKNLDIGSEQKGCMTVKRPAESSKLNFRNPDNFITNRSKASTLWNDRP